MFDRSFYLFCFLFLFHMEMSMQWMHNTRKPNIESLSRNFQCSIVHNTRTPHAQRNVMHHAVLVVACDQGFRLTKVVVNSKPKKWHATKNHVVYRVSVVTSFHSKWIFRRTKTFLISEYCYRLPKIDRRTCTEAKEAINKYYYNMDARRCEVFTTNCAAAENEFELLQECLTNCTGLTEFGRELQEARGVLWKWFSSQANVLKWNFCA